MLSQSDGSFFTPKFERYLFGGGAQFIAFSTMASAFKEQLNANQFWSH